MSSLRPTHSIALVCIALCIGLSGCESDRTSKTSDPKSTDHALARQARVLPAVGDKPFSIQAGAIQASAAPGYALTLTRVYIPPPQWTHPGGFELVPEFNHTEIADVTGDGRRDLIAVLGNVPDGYQLLVFAQNPDGTLAAPQYIVFPQPAYEGARWIRVADMNRDGVGDPILVRGESIHILLSRPGGQRVWSNVASTSLAIDTAPVVADFDGDGNNDIVAHLSSWFITLPPDTDKRGRLLLLMGDGRGGIARQEVRYTYGSDPHDVERATGLAVGDFDGDSDPDVAMNAQQFDYWGQRWNYRADVYPYDRIAGFGPPRNIGSDPQSKYLVAGDFNGDGRADVAISNEEVDPLKTRFSLYLQRMDGTFSDSPIVKSTYLQSVDPEAVDLDQDGDTDLVVGHNGAGRVGRYLQSGGVLENAVYHDYGGYAGVGETSQSVGDLDGDSCPEVAIAVRYDGLFVMKGSGCAPRRRLTSIPLRAALSPMPAARAIAAPLPQRIRIAPRSQLRFDERDRR